MTSNPEASTLQAVYALEGFLLQFERQTGNKQGGTTGIEQKPLFMVHARISCVGSQTAQRALDWARRAPISMMMAQRALVWARRAPRSWHKRHSSMLKLTFLDSSTDQTAQSTQRGAIILLTTNKGEDRICRTGTKGSRSIGTKGSNHHRLARRALDSLAQRARIFGSFAQRALVSLAQGARTIFKK